MGTVNGRGGALEMYLGISKSFGVLMMGAGCTNGVLRYPMGS